MRQPDRLPAFCPGHRNGRPLIGYGRRPAVGSAGSSPGSARSRTATSAQGRRPISTAALRASPKPGCRSCSVRRNAGRTPALRSVGGLRPICARARSLRARFGTSEPYSETASGAVSAGSNPAGGTAQRHRFQYFDGKGQRRRRALAQRESSRRLASWSLRSIAAAWSRPCAPRSTAECRARPRRPGRSCTAS